MATRASSASSPRFHVAGKMDMATVAKLDEKTGMLSIGNIIVGRTDSRVEFENNVGFAQHYCLTKTIISS